MKKISFLALLAFAGFSCTDADNLSAPSMQEKTSAAAQTRAASTTEFEVLPNPYTLANMQAVYNEAGQNVTLQPNYLYVRFLPQDSLQMNRLKYDLNLELFDYPLDLQIEDDEIYADPTIPEGQFTWQYTTVPVGFSPPIGITYQLLEYCYIPEDEESISTTRGGSLDVEMAAFERLGYTVEPETPTRALFERPTGRITVFDDGDGTGEGEYIPVKGVKIRCHTVVKWSTAFTDENGYYKMGSKFMIGPHYAIVFDNTKDFDIWGNWGPIARANYNMGWHSKSGHNRAIPKSSQAWPWAVVNNVGYDYYKMCEQTKITKPPSNLKIWVSDMWTVGATPMLRRVWHPIGINGNSSWVNFLSNMAIGVPLGATALVVLNSILKLVEPDIMIDVTPNTYKRAYERIIHELAHASHFNSVGSAYWAKYISYIITYGSYGDGTGNNAELCGIGEMWAYAMEHIHACEKYAPDSLSSSYPGSTLGNWIKPHVFWNLITKNILTKKQVYDCLTSDVDTFYKLIAKMYQKYPDKAGDIEAAFVLNGIVRNVPRPTPPPVNFSISGPTNPKPGGENIFTANSSAPFQSSITWSVVPTTGVRYISPFGNTCTINFSGAAEYLQYSVIATATIGNEQRIVSYNFKMGKYDGEFAVR